MKVTNWRNWYRTKIYIAIICWLTTLAAIGGTEQAPGSPAIPYPRLAVASGLMLIFVTISLVTGRRE